MRLTVFIVTLLAAAGLAAQQPPNPRQQPGAAVTMFAPDQHDLYDGRFVLSAGRVYMVGGLNDTSGWDHMDNAAATVQPVSGTAEIDVDEIANTGTFEARLKIPEGDLVVAIDRFHEFAPCQNGGIVAFLHEHGTDSGCGDNNWPKTFVYLAGWGYGHATLNGKPLYQDYEMHFMVTQGMRDRKTLRVNYPMAGKKRWPARSIPRRSRSTSTSAARSRIRRTNRRGKCSCTSSAWKSRGASRSRPAAARRRAAVRAWRGDALGRRRTAPAVAHRRGRPCPGRRASGHRRPCG